MSHIILSTSIIGAPSDSGESELVEINIYVESEDWMGHFNRLQVYRSTTGASGIFEEITDEAWSPPRLPRGAGDPPVSPVSAPLVNLVGRELLLLVNSDMVTITFTGSDPLTFGQAATQIAAQSNHRLSSYVDALGNLVIESALPGLGSRLEVLNSEGAFILGLPSMRPDSLETGKDPRPMLVQSQEVFRLVDIFGSREYYYKTRFYNTVTEAVSEFTIPFKPKPVGITPSNIVIGFLDIVYPNGNCWVGAEVHVYSESTGPLYEDRLIGSNRTVKYTDEEGHVEFNVVRGARLTLSVQGSNLVRTLTVPTDPALKKFNFLNPAIADEDVFKVSVPDIITAERRTL